MAEDRRSRRLPIAPGHPLYPMLVLIALVGIAFGPVGRDATEDMPERETHPYYPDHFWPYTVLAMVVIVALGLLAVFGQSVLEPGQPADPRAAINPIPEWYFLALFQFAKLGPALLTKMLIPALLLLSLIFWPLLDAQLGPRVARRLGWKSWPVPRRNAITGTIWFGSLAIIGVLTLWAALWPQLCIPWFFNGPVCGA